MKRAGLSEWVLFPGVPSGSGDSWDPHVLRLGPRTRPFLPLPVASLLLVRPGHIPDPEFACAGFRGWSWVAVGGCSGLAAPAVPSSVRKRGQDATAQPSDSGLGHMGGRHALEGIQHPGRCGRQSCSPRAPVRLGDTRGQVLLHLVETHGGASNRGCRGRHCSRAGPGGPSEATWESSARTVSLSVSPVASTVSGLIVTQWLEGLNWELTVACPVTMWHAPWPGPGPRGDWGPWFPESIGWTLPSSVPAVPRLTLPQWPPPPQPSVPVPWTQPRSGPLGGHLSTVGKDPSAPWDPTLPSLSCWAFE